MAGRLVVVCMDCHLELPRGVDRPLAAGYFDGVPLCDDHAPTPPPARHLRLVPFCGDDLAHGLTDGWAR